MRKLTPNQVLIKQFCEETGRGNNWELVPNADFICEFARWFANLHEHSQADHVCDDNGCGICADLRFKGIEVTTGGCITEANRYAQMRIDKMNQDHRLGICWCGKAHSSSDLR